MERSSPDLDLLRALAVAYRTQPLPFSFSPANVVLSVLVSLGGCYSTLVLLGRRGGNKGTRNVVHLVCAATLMAMAGIFSMHYLASFLLLHPAPGIVWHVHFSPGLTALTFFIPFLSLCVSFVVLGGQFKLDRTRVLVTGLGCGLTMALMHFLAGLHATLLPVYHPGHAVGATVLACAATAFALAAFFQWRQHWQDSPARRLACALLLTGGVCGMHYLALSGTRWFVPKTGHFDPVSALKNPNRPFALAVAGLSALSSCSVIGLGFYGWVRQRSRMRQDQRLVVAWAAFSKDGQLLVKPDGTLPMHAVYVSLSEKTLSEDLAINRRTFARLYTLTWSWSLLSPYIDQIRALLSDITNKGAMPLTDTQEAFILASEGLAQQLGLPIDQLGILFNKSITLGRGVGDNSMLVLVHQLPDQDSAEISNFTRKGFRLSSIRDVDSFTAARLNTSDALMREAFEQLKMYARRGTRTVLSPQSVYVALFAVRPSGGQGEVLVFNFARHQIPAFRLPDVSELSQDAIEFVKRLENLSITEINDVIRRVIQGEPCPLVSDLEVTPRFFAFASAFRLAVVALLDCLRACPGAASQARISSRLLEIPSNAQPGVAQMIAFTVLLHPFSPGHGLALYRSAVTENDQSTKKHALYTFTSLPFFIVTQAMLMGSSDRTRLEVARSLESLFVSKPDAGKRHQLSQHAIGVTTVTHATPRQMEEAHLNRAGSGNRPSLSASRAGHLISPDLFVHQPSSFASTIAVHEPVAATKSKAATGADVRPRAALGLLSFSPLASASARPFPADGTCSRAPLRGRPPITAQDVAARMEQARKHCDGWVVRLLRQMEEAGQGLDGTCPG